MSGRINISNRVKNKDRRFGSAPVYYPAYIVMGGKRHPALFTWAQLAEAMRRASENPEDVPPVTRWQRVKRWFLG